MAYWITTVPALILGCAVVLHVGRGVLVRQTSYPLPPGPPGFPWIGNAFGINSDTPWITYAEWARTYGELVHSRLFGKDVIIINSEKIAKDLLEDRSRNYSDRPYLITNELCGLYFNTVLMPYGSRWRIHRQFFHQTFRPDAVPRFLPLLQDKTSHLLRRLLNSPEQFKDHVFEYTVSIILNSVYGYDPASRKDELFDILENALEIVVSVVRPELAIVIGAFPLLLHLPSWFPGISFKGKMAAALTYAKLYVERPFEYSLRKAPNSSDEPSMVHDALRSMEEKGVSPEDSWMDMLKEASGTGFLAASETSTSTLMTFFLMMVLNPDVQEKAQAQIDAVVGGQRLPTVGDRSLLPLLDTIFWETLRYGPVAPLSIPHAAVNEDIYEGYRIPKGAILLTNLWSMAHDESRFTNSHVFMPERFLNQDGSLKPNEIEHIAFGFGRRMCVGRRFADTSVWLAIAKVLAVFKILQPLDENGKEVPVQERFQNGIVAVPAPFKCRIVPRFPGMDGEKLEELIAGSV